MQCVVIKKQQWKTFAWLYECFLGPTYYYYFFVDALFLNIFFSCNLLIWRFLNLRQRKSLYIFPLHWSTFDFAFSFPTQPCLSSCVSQNFFFIITPSRIHFRHFFFLIMYPHKNLRPQINCVSVYTIVSSKNFLPSRNQSLLSPFLYHLRISWRHCVLFPLNISVFIS